MTASRSLQSAIAAAALLSGVGAAPAEVQVAGSAQAVHVEAHEATLREVLEALREKFNLHYRSDDVLETPKTGVFDGSLHRVLARILDGYNYAMTIRPDGVDVLVLRQDAVESAAVAAAAAALRYRPPLTGAEANHFAVGHLR